MRDLVVDCVKAKKYLPGKLQSLLKREGSDALTVEMLDVVAPSLSSLERLARKPFLAFFEPPSLSARIMNQAALLSVSSRADLSMTRWLHGYRELFRRILIPAMLKQEIRDKPDQANINERTLFPGLGGVSLWLTRYYSPTGARQFVSRDFRDARNSDPNSTTKRQRKYASEILDELPVAKSVFGIVKNAPPHCGIGELQFECHLERSGGSMHFWRSQQLHRLFPRSE